MKKKLLLLNITKNVLIAVFGPKKQEILLLH